MILLDTHVIVWLAGKPGKLSKPATRAIAIAAASGGVAIASITLWEVAMLLARGRLRGAGSIEHAVRELIEARPIVVRELTPTIAAIAAQFPDQFPRDPCDRIIAATAMAEGIALVTHDADLLESPLVKTIW